MKCEKQNYGTTLIELLVILMIITIIMSIVIPKVQKRDYYMMAISRILRDEIRKIRYMKMTEGKNYRILLAYDKYLVVENTRQIKKVKLEKNFKIVHNISDGDISFSYIGAPLHSGTILIFDDETNDYCELTIVPATGRVLLKNEILEGYKENKSNY